MQEKISSCGECRFNLTLPCSAAVMPSVHRQQKEEDEGAILFVISAQKNVLLFKLKLTFGLKGCLHAAGLAALIYYLFMHFVPL